ncbi:SGNH hydrolase-type esterase domain-containing protein [Plectosphaerella plurivora]|uniref:SGNH hydrolase-type esterase domain-containing protein n=1 Tax=Plectosphaerella plurivora TaxID=936078 RepID=A0A9P9AA77_9PEZI|nr:SGNH hydrolase-type esterase domain-containing protein [Plectosphaerella plurivora]
MVGRRHTHHAHDSRSDVNLSSAASPLAERQSNKNPSDMTWIKRWAVIGDSYTAGIGAGRLMGHRPSADEVAITLPDGFEEERKGFMCSRYDRSYPMVIKAQFGNHVESFQNLACSGDRSEQIFQQAEALDGDLDFVTFTAGGNDLCLAGIIKSCIMAPHSPFSSESDCNTVIAKAQENVKSIITSNVKEILKALNDKMNDDGIVVVNGYAQFFDTSSDNCNTQRWDAMWLLGTPSWARLTKSRRETFNEMVLNINEAIRDAVDDAAKDSSIKYKVGYAEWDRWVWDEVDGQMCSPNSKGYYPDDNQKDMQFIKPNTHPYLGIFGKRDELQKRQVNRVKASLEARDRALAKSMYDSVLFNSPAPGAEVRHRLNKRAPAPPGCPGDDQWIIGQMFSALGMPDWIGRNFHPNIAGHVTIASSALSELMDLRSIVLGVEQNQCPISDEFLCYSKVDSRHYVSADRADLSYEKFCKEVTKEHDRDTINWDYSAKYDEGTPEEHEYLVQMQNGASEFDEDECIESMKKLIHSCDTSDNPMNWKQGGRYTRASGDVVYELNPRRNNRPWPPPKKAYGRCEGWYKLILSAYTIEGAGFATWDHGQKTMLPKMGDCYGLGTTRWRFEYYDRPQDHNGYEWKATFNTPVFVRARCFKNNKVVEGAGGWTDGCGGNDA